MAEGMIAAGSRGPRLTNAGLVSAVLVGLVGAMVIFVTPGFLALIAQKAGLNNDQLGYIAAWDINAMAVAIGVSTFALSRVRWRHAVALSLVLIALGNGLTAMTDSFAGIAAARVVAGAGEGIAVGFAFAALGRAANPDRAFAIYLVVGALFSSGLLFMLPVLQAAMEPAWLFIANAVLALLVLFSLRHFPDGSADEDDVFAGGGKLDLPLAGGALLGVFLYFFATGAIWSYSERIGIGSGLTPDLIATGLSLGTLAGVLGAALAGMLPRRWGRSWPLLISGGVSVTSFLLLRDNVSAVAFIASTTMLLFGWNFAQPLLSGICSEACARGRVVCAMGSIQTFGTGLGPAAAAATLVTGSFNLAIYGSAIILVASLLITIFATHRTPRRLA
ncbi:MAG: MFS transporter [Alphaproteobacteria bacterium]|nr:MFS transporter [Alphaproteobacteria bacterium]MBU0794987.1 MFS transporter [Alphaproteobacteria bacterium]MBU0876645.1 MFS transporter [Alphaproteobacteria bacterium]MBU1769347.1 MFS transporter [Alphaproteobacteria bacterium]